MFIGLWLGVKCFVGKFLFNSHEDSLRVGVGVLLRLRLR